MKVNAKAGHPDRVRLRDPRVLGAWSGGDPQARGQKEVHANRRKRNKPRKQRVPAPYDPGENAGNEQNNNQPDQDHKNSTTATNTTAPPAIAAMYQRTRPVSVALKPRYNRSVSRATPV